MSEILLPVFPSGIFVVSSLTLRSLTHVEFILCNSCLSACRSHPQQHRPPGGVSSLLRSPTPAPRSTGHSVSLPPLSSPLSAGLCPCRQGCILCRVHSLRHAVCTGPARAAALSERLCISIISTSAPQAVCKPVSPGARLIHATAPGSRVPLATLLSSGSAFSTCGLHTLLGREGGFPACSLLCLRPDVAASPPLTSPCPRLVCGSPPTADAGKSCLPLCPVSSELGMGGTFRARGPSCWLPRPHQCSGCSPVTCFQSADSEAAVSTQGRAACCS